MMFFVYLIIDWILWIGNTSNGCFYQFVDLIAQLIVNWAYFFQHSSNFNQTINRRITFDCFACDLNSLFFFGAWEKPKKN